MDVRPSPPAPRPWRGLAPAKRDEQRRRRLLDAALELFGNQGFARTTVAGVCSEANVATRSFYELFGSREELLLALYEEIITELAEGMTLAMAEHSGDLRHWVRAGVAAVIQPLTADERKGRVAELEVIGVSPPLERRRREVVRAFAAMIDQEIDRAMAAGLLDPFDKGMLSLVMSGGVTEALIDHLQTPKRRRRPVPELVDAITAVWLRALAPR